MRKALILIALVPLAVGCGAKKSALTGSSGALKDAGSSRVEMTIVGGKDQPLFSGTGAIDYSRNRGELLLSTKGKPSFPGGAMRLRFFGRTSYVGWMLQGKLRWMKQVEEPSGIDRFIPGVGDSSPDRLLELLVKSSKRVEILGTETIRGVAATHYRGHIDPKKLGEDLSGPGENDNIVIDAWIDEGDLVRRLRVPDAGDSMVLEFFDFGTKVDVEAPPADQVLSEENFFKLFAQDCRSSRDKAFRESEFCTAFAVGSGEGSAPTETKPRVTKAK